MAPIDSEPVIVRKAISMDIPALMAFDHGVSTDHVWQLALDRGSGEIAAHFREVRLPRPMRLTYPRDPGSLADQWTHRAAVLLAEAGDRPVGYLALVDGPAQGSGWVTDLVVNLPQRRRGVASQLLSAALQWCLERGYQRLFLEMVTKNYPAIQLARKSGFLFSGYSDQYYPDQDIALFFSHAVR